MSNSEKPGSTQKNISSEAEQAASRRRFIKRAVGTSPVVLSLASRPAWGLNCSLSGLMSATHASHHDMNTPCENWGSGCTPGFWKSNPKAWKVFNGTYVPGNVLSCPSPTSYDDDDSHHTSWKKHKKSDGDGCFLLTLGSKKYSVRKGASDWDDTGTTFSAIFGAGYSSKTLMQVLHTEQGSVNFHACAAVLNSIAFPGEYGYSASDVVEAYQAIMDGGDSQQISNLHDTLDYLNNRGCPINAHGEFEY